MCNRKLWTHTSAVRTREGFWTDWVVMFRVVPKPTRSSRACAAAAFVLTSGMAIMALSSSFSHQEPQAQPHQQEELEYGGAEETLDAAQTSLSSYSDAGSYDGYHTYQNESSSPKRLVMRGERHTGHTLV